VGVLNAGPFGVAGVRSGSDDLGRGETDDLLRLGLHRLTAGDFPLLRGLAPVLAAYDGAAELERGLDILLAGLTTTLTPPGQTRPNAGRTPRRSDRARTRL
jgi:hypothetical protein